LTTPSPVPPTQDEILEILVQTHAADMLRADLPPEVSLRALSRDQQKTARFKSRFLNPLSIRLPLLDPDRFLSRTQSLVSPVFGVAGLIVWACSMAAAVLAAAMHWGEFTANWSDRIFTLGNAMLMAAIYPVVKSLHELGHGYAIKRFGGEVHQMG